MDYPVEPLTDAERARLAPHVTNLDRPVFALVNLPETVKGALFARYSRYPGTLRRLFLDEFAGDLLEDRGLHDSATDLRFANVSAIPCCVTGFTPSRYCATSIPGTSLVRNSS